VRFEDQGTSTGRVGVCMYVCMCVYIYIYIYIYICIYNYIYICMSVCVCVCVCVCSVCVCVCVRETSVLTADRVLPFPHEPRTCFSQQRDRFPMNHELFFPQEPDPVLPFHMQHEPFFHNILPLDFSHMKHDPGLLTHETRPCISHT